MRPPARPSVKALRFSRFGKAHEVVELVELPDPGRPGAGEVALDIEASPINPADLLQFEGRYGAQPPALPVHAGGEAVGIVRAVGPGVDHLKVGDRVLALLACRGNWRTRQVAPAARLFALPDADPLQLAMLTVNPATARLMLGEYATLERGDWVIQNAANSGVGHCVIALAKAAGLRTLNVVRRADLAPALEALGADAVLVDGPDLDQRVMAITSKDGLPKLGIDAVAGDATARLGRSLADGATVVNYGLLSGQPCVLDSRDLVFRDVRLRGFWLARWFATVTQAQLSETYAALTRLVSSGVIHVPIEATYPLAEAARALEHASREARDGKVLITPNA